MGLSPRRIVASPSSTVTTMSDASSRKLPLQNRVTSSRILVRMPCAPRLRAARADAITLSLPNSSSSSSAASVTPSVVRSKQSPGRNANCRSSYADFGNSPSTVPPSVRIVASSPRSTIGEECPAFSKCGSCCILRRVPSVLKMQHEPLTVDHSIEESDELARRNAAAQHFVQLAAQRSRPGAARREGPDRCLKIRHQQRRCDPFTRDIRNADPQPIRPQREHVKVVTAHRPSWLPRARNLEWLHLRQLMRQKMNLNLMRRLQLGFMGLQLDLPHRDLVFQLTIPLFKPRPRLPRNKENNSDDKREKRATPDRGPIKLKQILGLAGHDPYCHRCDPTRHRSDREKNNQIREPVPGGLLLCDDRCGEKHRQRSTIPDDEGGEKFLGRVGVPQQQPDNSPDGHRDAQQHQLHLPKVEGEQRPQLRKWPQASRHERLTLHHRTSCQ